MLVSLDEFLPPDSVLLLDGISHAQWRGYGHLVAVDSYVPALTDKVEQYVRGGCEWCVLAGKTTVAGRLACPTIGVR
ncbi:hypothetical protein V6U81_12075 [Micromonospora sp. CPCC 205711]|uniref:hypothetical protein n=1 Tax=Micromonospora sp. CPCC 205547 TaxID=3122400 RepID=UPI002FF2A5A2